MIKKIFGIFVVLMMFAFATAKPALAWEPRTASAHNEQEVWMDYLNKEVTTEQGNEIKLIKNPGKRGYIIVFHAGTDNLDLEVEGVHCTKLSACYEFSGMNNAILDEFMRY